MHVEMRMRRTISGLLVAGVWVALAAPGAMAQEEEAGGLAKAAIGGGLGVIGGAAMTLSIVVARAQLQEQFLDSPHDLIHWQTAPMIIGPAAGVVFGLAGEEVLVGSIVGSVLGLVGGAGIGAGAGWLVSAQPEAPWAGGVIGAGMGLAVGGVTGALIAWKGKDDGGSPDPAPSMRFGVRMPL